MAIFKLTAYDLMCTKIVDGNYYVTTDSKQIYRDASGVRNLMSVNMIATESQRLNNVMPTVGSYYYVWETNTLWVYNAKWIVVEGNSTYATSGYYYANSEITPTDPVEVIDNNGLLKDGSVVVRNADRIIKGKLYIQSNEDSSDLIVSSYLGGGIKLLPSGSIDDTGALELFSANTYTGQFDGNGNPITTQENGELVFYGDMYVTDGTNRFKVLTSRDGYTYEAGEGIILGNTTIYILLLEEPDDWSTHYTDYFVFDSDTQQYVANTNPTYADDTYYVSVDVPNQIAVQDYSNLIKGVKVGGTTLTPDVNNMVDIPKATTSSLGVVQVGSGLSIDSDGILSADVGSAVVISGTTDPTSEVGDDDSLYVKYIDATPDQFDSMFVKLDGEWIPIDMSDVKTMELTQAQYDQLTPEEKMNGTIYFITDGGDTSIALINDTVVSLTKTWSSSKINTELNGKANTSAIPTKTSQLQNNSGFITSSALPTKLSDLSNDEGFTVVSVSQTISTGTQIATITIDGTTTTLYAPNGGGGATDLDDLTDVTITTPTDGQVLKYDSANNVWVNANESGGGGSSTLSGLTDVDLTTPSDGQMLSYDDANSKWVNSNVPKELPTVTSADEGKFLTVDGNGDWVATTISAWNGGSF